MNVDLSRFVHVETRFIAFHSCRNDDLSPGQLHLKQNRRPLAAYFVLVPGLINIMVSGINPRAISSIGINPDATVFPECLSGSSNFLQMFLQSFFCQISKRVNSLDKQTRYRIPWVLWFRFHL